MVGKGQRCAIVHKYFPYPSHEAEYQGYLVTFGAQVPWLSTQVHPGRDGVNGHFLTQHGILVHCQA